MSWKDRLRPTIKLTSPEGNVFEALWAGNQRTLAKKLGIFEYSKVKGAVVQDHDVGAMQYPLTFFFDGDDHDVEADRFIKACEENGRWEIIHPVRGKLKLQLVSVTESINPIESGNVTQFETSWIAAIDDAVIKSTSQLSAEIANQADITNLTAADQLSENVKQDKFTEKLALASTMDKIVNAVKTNLAPLYETLAEVNAQVQSIYRGVQDTITQVTVDVLSLAGQIQNLVQFPALVSDDIDARLNAYSGFIAEALNISTCDDLTNRGKNIVSIQEVALTAAIIATANVVITGNLKTRKQAIESIESISALFVDITDGLDDIQEAFKDNDIDIQYFSQSSSFSDASIIVAQASAYLLKRSFDLAIERKFTTERPRAPIEITITEYGDLGADDANLDLFIAANNLKNIDILILPAGREVVVYV